MRIFDEALRRLSEKGFAPLAPLEKSKPTYTLHNLIFDVLGLATWKEVQTDNGVQVHIEADDSTAAFWDWKELATYVGRVYLVLDNAASNINGNPTNAIGWAHNQSRKQSEIEDLLTHAKKVGDDLGKVPTAVRRPYAKNISSRYSVDTAIGNTLAVLKGNGSSYYEILGRLSQMDLENGELLHCLDIETKAPKFDRGLRDNKSLMPRLIVNAYATYKNRVSLGQVEVPQICTFFAELNLSPKTTPVSDSALAERLVPWLSGRDIESAKAFGPA